MALFRITFVLILAVIGALLSLLVHGIVDLPLYFAVGATLVSYLLTWIAGNASRGVALRPVIGKAAGSEIPDPPEGTLNSKAWYIQSDPSDKQLPHSCSFVEFDERGDYLDFRQHLHAYQKIKSLAAEHEKLIIVIFVHGWRNGVQSGNVLSFNEFLHQLATFSDSDGSQHRVHGLYLAWRGGCLKPAVRKDRLYEEVTGRHHGNPIVDLGQAAFFPWLNETLETFSYFDRKGVPEHLFSGTALSRTLFTCAHAAKRFSPHCNVFLIGHSFGGLMLERTFQNATISQLTMSWPWGDEEMVKTAKANPLPFDTVLLVNSAAPSIYAKQFQSYLAAHRQAMVRYGVTGANSPIFFSLTSSGDWATGKAHLLANTFCFLLPTLRRNYRGDDFILAPGNGSGETLIQQSYYYRHTPGHNPLLVNRFVEPHGRHPVQAPPADGERSKSLHANLLDSSDPLEFTTSPRDGETPLNWKINFPPETEVFDGFSRYKNEGRYYRPVVWEQQPPGVFVHTQSAYWILRCTKEIIKDHNDIWSQQAMDTYAALYRIALKLRREKFGGSPGPDSTEL